MEGQRDVCAERGGEVVDRAGDLARVVVAILEEGSRAESAVDGSSLVRLRDSKFVCSWAETYVPLGGLKCTAGRFKMHCWAVYNAT